MIIFARNFNSIDTTDGPTISIINNLKNLKKKENILIINSLTADKKRYENFKYKNLNIKTISFGSISEFFKLFLSHSFELRKHKIVEFHCIYDFFGCFLSCLILNKLNKNFYFKFYLRGMVNKKIFQKKKILKVLYLFFIKMHMPKHNSELISTSIYEKNLANEIFKNKFKINILPNKIEKKILLSKNKIVKKKKNHLNLFFMSNITWKKNFDFVFEVLNKLDFKITLNIYGSVYENKSKFIQMLNILKHKHKINFCGEYKHKDLNKIIKENHLMILPTFDENFGHCIVETLLSFRPCLISNNTPWNDLSFYEAGYALPLGSKNSYINAIKEFYSMDNKRYQKICLNAKNYLITKYKNKDF